MGAGKSGKFGKAFAIAVITEEILGAPAGKTASIARGRDTPSVRMSL